MKKKIIFMIINMNVGGTEKALLNMIAEMPKDKYDITILMLKEYGGFLDAIPSEVHVEYLNGYNHIKEILNDPPKRVAGDLFKKGKFVKAFNIMFFHFITRIMKDRRLFFKYLLNNISSLKNEYDLAVAYAGPMDFISYFVVKKIKAKKKIQWIHFDITKIGFNKHFASKIYKKFDKIFVVSNEGKNKLIDVLPSCQEKIEAFPNIMSPNTITKMADEGVGFEDEFSGVRILTVGRLSKEKGQDLTIRVCAKLKESGYNVRWYCIGEGNARSEYEQLIKQSDLQKDYILLGSNPNPYPFMKQCDIYVQPSRHEGYCITLSEARCFDNPIISTDFTGAKEQIKSGETGLIVSVNENEIYHAIIKLLNDKKLRNKLSDNLLKEKINIKKSIDLLNKL